MKRYKKHSIVGTSALLFAIYCLMIYGCNDGKSTNQYIDESGFMGDLSCQSCHQKEYDEWYGSHHDLAMQEADSSTILGDFGGVEFESNGVRSRFFKQGSKFFVNTEGPTGENDDFEVKYAFGVTPLQQYLVEFPGGRLQCLHTAYDTEKKEWFDLMPQERLPVDDWLHWTKGSMTWNTMCADCHSTNLRKNYDQATDSYNTEWSIIDVSCEACHGPSREHFRYVNSADYKAGKKVQGSFMEQGVGLSKAKQIDDCARCHSRRGQITNAYDYKGQFMDHYTPSLISPRLYFADGQILDEVYVYGSFLQSLMNHRNVSCMDCHNPHSLKLKFEDNMLCTQCHVKETYDASAHHFHQMDTEAAQCVSCHMTGRTYMGNDFRRDHSMRVPRPDQSILYDTPNACTGCHTDQSDSWASEAVIKWYGPERQPHYSDVFAGIQQGNLDLLPDAVSMVGDTSVPEIIQASLVDLMGSVGDYDSYQAILRALKHEDPLVRYGGVNAMANAPLDERVRQLTPLLSDPVKTVRSHTVFMLADASEGMFSGELKGYYENAVKDFETTMKNQADFPSGQLMIGQYYHKKQNIELAQKAYLEAIRQDPYLPQPYFYMGNIRYNEGNQEKTKEYFEKAIELDSNYVNAYYSLGLLQAEMQDLESAEKSLAQAAILSGNPRYYYNWGLTLQNLDKRKEAEKAFLQGIAIFPNSEANWYALTILYIQNKENDKARSSVSRLLAINPNNPEYQNLVNAIQ